MAVMRNSIIFGGVDSADFGIYIGGEGTFNAPKRDVEMISIPGRNGAFALDKGRFENIEVTYSAFNFEPDLATFSAQLEAFRNAICSQKGYQRLTDTFHPDEYRMAAYIDGLEIKPINFNTASTFDIVFDCKPQRFLTSGEEPITIGEWHETETASGEIASFEAEDGDAVKSLVADIEPIQDLHGYDKPWSGGAGKNKLPNNVQSKTQDGITFTVNSDGTVKVNGTATAVVTLTQSNPFLKAGSYILSGCPSGGGSSTYEILLNTGSGTVYRDYGSGKAFTLTNDTTFASWQIVVRSGVTVNNLVFKPMVEQGSTATDYEPYSNVCPISGYDSVVVSRCGKNLLPKHAVGTGTRTGITYTYNSDGTIELNGTATTTTNITIYNSGDVSQGLQGSYILNGSVGGTLPTYRISARVRDTSAGTTRDVSVSNGDKAITTSASEVINSVYIVVYNGVTLSNKVFYPMIRLASETDDTYEPYQGTTYTTSLNGTRYGGTLDVASGVLTVTKAMVDLGTLNWTRFDTETSGKYRFATSGLSSVIKKPSAYAITGWLTCSAFAEIKGDAPYFNHNGIGLHTNGNIIIYDEVYATYSSGDFKTAMNGVQLVYELATPQTYQLTAQEVELLVGLNQVWANSGDVEVEYGTRPSAIYNPTLFESSPMLEVTGYGEIGIGDDTIVVNDTPIGDIYISEGGTITRRDNELSITLPITFETRDLNGGDKFYISDATAAIQSTVKSGYTTDGCSASSFDTAATTNATGTSKAMRMKYSMIFIYNEGTLPAQSDSNTATFFDRWTHGGTAGSNSAIFTISGSYTGGNTLTLTLTIQLSECFDNLTVKSLTLPRVRAKSTKSALGTPTYIDLDIGEAWNADSGEPVSANNAVIFPSTLPTLKPGVTEFSLPGSVTDLKVVPRFWKI